MTAYTQEAGSGRCGRAVPNKEREQESGRRGHTVVDVEVERRATGLE
jgi:hypothetical protein